MPSSSPSVRLVFAALLAVTILIAPALAGPLATAAQAAPALPPADQQSRQIPFAPPDPDRSMPVSLQLVSIDPTSLAPGGTVTAVVSVTNTSSRPLEDVMLQLRTRTARVTDREAVAAWQADESADTTGAPIAESAAPATLAPGESTELTVQASAAELGYIDEPYFWGTRRLSVTAVAGEEPLAAIRTFTVWRPAQVEDSITQSVLLPIASHDPAMAVTAPEVYEQSVEDGSMADLLQIAARDDVDWWLDPALLDPPAVPVTQGQEETPEGEDAPQPVLEHAPDPISEQVATTLEESVGERTVLAMPYAHADLIALEAAGADTLAGAATARGETVWEETGVSPQVKALSLPGQRADADTLRELAATGADAAIVPSSSLRADTASTVTPSSVAVFDPEGSRGADGTAGTALPVLAPDPELSDTFALLDGDEDSQQAKQRLLAETATIASEYTTVPRHVLISPPTGTELDAEATELVLDAFAEAPWIEQGRTGDLLEVAESGRWTTQTRDESGDPYALGRLDEVDVHPSAPNDVGRWEPIRQAREIPALDPQALTDLQGAWQKLDTLSTIMVDDTSLEPARLLALSGTSWRWRTSPDVSRERADEADTAAQALLDRIEVVPASGYNLISDSAGVPITVTNRLDTAITVRPAVSSDRPLVRVGDQELVEVPARGQVDFTVQVEAIANGTVTLTVLLTSEDGRVVTDPVDVPLTVNPAWENWTTMLVVVAMGVLVVFGIARARRTGSASRAPAVHSPEDPVELSRTGRSLPEPETGPPAPGDPDEPREAARPEHREEDRP